MATLTDNKNLAVTLKFQLQNEGEKSPDITDIEDV